MDKVTKAQGKGQKDGPPPADAYEVALQMQEEKDVRRIWAAFADKTIWDWLILFGTLAIPVVVMCATIVFSVQQGNISQAQHDNELRIAEANRQNDLRMANDQEEETTLAAYLDGITGLLLDNRLGSSVAPRGANVVARAKTMVVLSRLRDPSRKSMIVRFLYEAYLISGKAVSVSLAGVDLRTANLSATELSGANLSGANLSGANLRAADLKNANLRATNLKNANLKGANLTDADLSGADMTGANLKGANLTGAIITHSQLQETEIH